MKTNFFYLEDNGGGLYLFVADDNGNIIAGIKDLEHAQANEWQEVADSLLTNAIKEVSSWEGQIEDAQAVHDELTDNPLGYNEVAANGYLFSTLMGAAARRYFGIDQ